MTESKRGGMLKRFPVFIGGSAMGAVIDYVVTLSASDVLHLPPTVALALAMVASGSLVFFFHDRVTFGRAKGSLLRRYALFMGWTCLVFFLRALLLQAGLHIGVPLAVALILAIGLASVVNFAISSAVIFAKRPS